MWTVTVLCWGGICFPASYNIMNMEKLQIALWCNSRFSATGRQKKQYDIRITSVKWYFNASEQPQDKQVSKS